jgi:cell wall-associated NlpC family hydrolase
VSKPLLPDPRLHAYRADLAADRLRGLVEAERFVAGEPRQVVAASLPLRREPRPASTLDTEVLKGETVTLYAEGEGWAWVQIDRDRYVGYVPSDGLSPKIAVPTHRIAALRSYVYSEPDGKSAALEMLSMNARVTARAEEGRFLALDGGGYVVAHHTLPVGKTAEDPVAIAEAFIGTPYLWGGRTSIGLDCSGLVQLAAEAAGLSAPRDADMQAAELGEPVSWREVAELGRGDLVFWDGHVGIATSSTHLLHANAHHMAVALEPFAEAEQRIKQAGYEVIGVRRLPRIDGRSADVELAGGVAALR